MRIYLGCGAVKLPGFIGIDRFNMPGVDIVADIDEHIPLEDNSVELVYASHSLEHVKHLDKVMEQIYRVCKHGAQLCIVAPYNEQKLNYANPYHLQRFNEHTPRFWTNYPIAPIPEEQWYHPHAKTWGLSESDHSESKIDIRCLRMEFFYFPEYRNLPEEERVKARREKSDVCDQIMYHLIVIKELVADDEFQNMSNNIGFFEPPYVTVRKQSENIESINFQKELLEQNISDMLLLIEELDKDKSIILAENEKLKRKIEDQKIIIHDKDTIIEVSEALYTKNEKELIILINDVENSKHQTHLYKEKYDYLMLQAKNVVNLKELLLGNKYYKIKHKLFDKNDMWDLINPNFYKLRDDSLIYKNKLKNYKLGLSKDLSKKSFEWYEINAVSGLLSGIHIALSLDLPATKGTIGIEIINSEEQIIVTSSKTLENIDHYHPVHFTFQKFQMESDKKYYLRIFTRNVDIPVRCFEFHKLLTNKRKPFIAYDINY